MVEIIGSLLRIRLRCACRMDLVQRHLQTKGLTFGSSSRANLCRRLDSSRQSQRRRVPRSQTLMKRSRQKGSRPQSLQKSAGRPADGVGPPTERPEATLPKQCQHKPTAKQDTSRSQSHSETRQKILVSDEPTRPSIENPYATKTPRRPVSNPPGVADPRNSTGDRRPGLSKHPLG